MQAVSEQQVAENVQQILQTVRQTALEAGRDPAEVQVMAVTKTVDPQLVNAAIAQGITLLGENKAQELCEKYGYYSFRNGTDGMIFINEPPVLGYYLKEKTYDSEVAKQALAEGHIVVSIQHKGYWTGGGHYIVLEKLNEDGTVQVRDSNLYNYSEYKVPAHAQDRHEWKDIVAAGSGYWIFEYKVTRIPLCARCGEPEEVAPAILTGGYCCPKCGEALLRRQVYLSLGTEGIC